MSKANQLVLVDADSLIYLAGIAGQNTHYELVYEDKDGDIYDTMFESAAERDDFLKLMEADDPEKGIMVLDQDKVVTPLPVEFSLRVCKVKLETIQRRYGKRMRVYIKGAEGKNFRDEVYTIQKYKGNRQTPKPYHYDAIVDYLVERWDAIRIEGKEVDDQVALDAYESPFPVVVCSPDKDLDQIPGKHWNYRDSVEYEVDEEEAKWMFWYQLLMGDSSDNIMGIWKCGKAVAKAKMEELWTDAVDEDAMWLQVVEWYEESQELPTCPYKDMDPREVALQTARAVWMQTERNRLWTPPGAPYEYMDIEPEEEWDG